MRAVVSDGPDLTRLLALHGGGDGSVAFGRKNDGGTFAHLWAIQVQHLEEMFPQFRAALMRDA